MDDIHITCDKCKWTNLHEVDLDNGVIAQSGDSAEISIEVVCDQVIGDDDGVDYECGHEMTITLYLSVVGTQIDGGDEA